MIANESGTNWKAVFMMTQRPHSEFLPCQATGSLPTERGNLVLNSG